MVVLILIPDILQLFRLNGIIELLRTDELNETNGIMELQR